MADISSGEIPSQAPPSWPAEVILHLLYSSQQFRVSISAPQTLYNGFVHNVVMHLVSLKARKRSGVDSGSFNSNEGIDASRGSPETSQHDMLRGFPSSYKGKDDEFKITEPEPLSESELKETNAHIGMTDQVGVLSLQLLGMIQRYSLRNSQGPTSFLPVVDAEQSELHACNNMAITPAESPRSGMGISVCSAVENRNSACFPLDKDEDSEFIIMEPEPLSEPELKENNVLTSKID
ncbi:hypothetical protein Acr_00g0093970 [Actinidia rufa]|uniref:Uncharacterized protein n=1 Tax=Actinidia rufa TaxID=165716 RepID=A0A7J0DYK0_9ERIC|nr:hypothetical protein Acr_00g0093970 [Actinidia rufa]